MIESYILMGWLEAIIILLSTTTNMSLIYISNNLCYMNQDHNDRQESKHRTDHEGDIIHI